MKLTAIIRAILPVAIVLLVAVTSTVQAQGAAEKNDSEEAIKDLMKFAKAVRPTAEDIVAKASNFAPDVVYEAHVLDLPERDTARQKYKSDFVALSIRSDKAATEVLCLRAARRNYWCQIRPSVESAKPRIVYGHWKSDLAKLVAIAMHNKYDVKPLSASKIAELAPELASNLKNVNLKAKQDVLVADLVKLHAAYIYSLRSYKNPLQQFLFEPSIDVQPFLAVQKIRGSRRFGRNEYKVILSQL